MDEQEFYYEWLKNDKAGLHFVIILRMPGSPEGLPDREV